MNEAPQEAEIGDDRLRLIFTCCHPALPPEGQVALTLREVCGMATEEIARSWNSTAQLASPCSRVWRGPGLIDALLAREELANYDLAHSARAELCRRQEPERRFLAGLPQELR